MIQMNLLFQTNLSIQNFLQCLLIQNYLNFLLILNFQMNLLYLNFLLNLNYLPNLLFQIDQKNPKILMCLQILKIQLHQMIQMCLLIPKIQLFLIVRKNQQYHYFQQKLPKRYHCTCKYCYLLNYK